MIGPKSVARGKTPEPGSISVQPRRRAHSWAWLVGLIVTLLLVWRLFGMDHLKPAVNPALVPAACVDRGLITGLASGDMEFR